MRYSEYTAMMICKKQVILRTTKRGKESRSSFVRVLMNYDALTATYSAGIRKNSLQCNLGAKTQGLGHASRAAIPQNRPDLFDINKKYGKHAILRGMDRR